jgi:Protein of unknown function (DUF1579)
MNTLPTSLIVLLAAALLTSPSFAQTTGTSPATTPATATSSPAMPGGQPTKADMEKMMAQMMELSKPGDNHKLLASMAGTWNYTVKMWMDGDTSGKPDESKGTATRKEALGGRYFIMDVSGKMDMPGPDGKKKTMDFKGMAIEGYDNIKKKFVSTWIDSMSTMIMISEGTYDPATKTFTYNAECEMMPGMHTKIREVIKIVDNDHHTFEWYEDREGKETKTMEIAYTRAGKTK